MTRLIRTPNVRLTKSGKLEKKASRKQSVSQRIGQKKKADREEAKWKEKSK